MRACATLLAAAIALGAAGCAAPPLPRSTLVVARVKDAVILDPALATDGMSLAITAEIFRTLVAFKPGTFSIVPDVARSARVSADGRSWTFRLAPRLRFSDGTPLDAQAVKFNLDRWRLRSNPYRGDASFAYYESMFGGFPGVIVEVRAPDPRTVVLRLRRPFGPLLHDLAMQSFGIGSPRAIRAGPAAFARRPVGSGPYVLAEWLRGDRIALKANPRYAGPPPAYRTVIVRDLPDPATSVLELQSGDVDVLIDPRPDDVARLARASELRVYRAPSNDVAYLALNLLHPPFDDVRVRRAVAAAVDTRAIARALYPSGTVAAGSFTPPGMLGEDRALVPRRPDAAAARALLAAAGFPNGFATELYYPTTPRPYLPEPQRIAEAVQADLRAVGIRIALRPLEFGVFLDRLRAGVHPTALIGWVGDNGDPDDFLYTLLDRDAAHVGSAQNYAFWRDPAFHALMLRGQRATDLPTRAAVYARANALVAREVPVLPLVHSPTLLLARRSVGGVVVAPDGTLPYELMAPQGERR